MSWRPRSGQTGGGRGRVCAFEASWTCSNPKPKLLPPDFWPLKPFHCPLRAPTIFWKDNFMLSTKFCSCFHRGLVLSFRIALITLQLR